MKTIPVSETTPEEMNRILQELQESLQGWEELYGIPTIQAAPAKECECGKDKHGFATHSDWCPKGEK